MMSAARNANERARQIACILGMAMVWPSIHNQLLYPVTFLYHKAGAGAPYLYYLAYSLIMLLVILLILCSDRKRVTERLFSGKGIMALIGVAGSAGIGLLVVCDFSHDGSQWLIGLGVALAAAFVPVYFMFWSMQLLYASVRRAGFDLIASYLVFCLITLAKLAFGLHGWLFSICYPLVSGALALYVLKTPSKRRFALEPNSLSALSGLPLALIVPSVIFVYVATVMRCLLNPMSATFEYPPAERMTMYVLVVFTGVLLALFYRPHGKIRRGADLPAFALTAAVLACGILLTGLGAFNGSPFGNLPAIAGINALELLIWVFALSGAQRHHTGILLPAALFLIIVIGACHLTSALVITGMDAFDVGSDQFHVLAIAIGLAFLVVIAVNTTVTSLLYRAQARSARRRGTKQEAFSSDAPADGIPFDPATLSAAMPPCLTIASDEAAVSAIKDAFGLSRRETDTLRLAAKDKPAKEIAAALFVAESTVNSHIKGIYRKCDVHSRKELIALVDRYRKEQEARIG